MPLRNNSEREPAYVRAYRDLQHPPVRIIPKGRTKYGKPDFEHAAFVLAFLVRYQNVPAEKATKLLGVDLRALQRLKALLRDVGLLPPHEVEERFRASAFREGTAE